MTRRLAVLLCIVISGCSRAELPTSPTVISPGNTAEPVRLITVGQEIKETLTQNGERMLFDFTAPSSGTLIVQLSWVRAQGRLELTVNKGSFTSAQPPIIGKIPVTRGETYELKVQDPAAWDDGGLSLPFVLTTTIE
jgi:hypothetical protein